MSLPVQYLILILAQGIQGVLNNLFYFIILKPRYTPVKCFAGMMASQVLYICIAHLFSLDGLQRWMGAVILQLIICRLFFGDGWRKIVFSIGVMYILAYLGEFAAEFLIRLTFPNQNGLPDMLMLLVGNAFFCIPYGLGILLFRRFWKRKSAELSEQSIYSTIVFPVIPFFIIVAMVYFLLICFSRVNNVLVPAINVAAGVCMCIGAMALMFRMLSETTKKDQLAQQLKLIERQSRLELAYYTALDEKTQEVRKIRHDFNNQLQTAYSVFAQGNQQEAREHLRQLEQRIDEVSPVYYCVNPIVNAILWDKEREAKAAGIDFQVKVRLSDKVGLEKVDLCSVFSNMLDNAIEAAASCPGGGRVTVQAYEQNGFCVVKTENTVAAQAGKKEKGEGHGYGIPILKSICKKYDGEFSARQQDGLYQTVLTLKLRCSSSEEEG